MKKRKIKKQYLKVKSTHRDVWFSIAVHVFFLCVTMIFLKELPIIDFSNMRGGKSENLKKKHNKIMKTRTEQKTKIEEKKVISNYI